MIERATTCEASESEERAIRYASGQLDAQSLASFEEHLLVCDACQELVRLTVGLRRAGEPNVLRTDRVPSRRRGIALTAAALVAIAAALFLVVGQLRVSRVRALGALDVAPQYDGLTVRAAPAAADSLFAAAMRDYAAQRYAAAATGLDALIVRGDGGVPALFFHGASSLMLARPSIARDDFSRVVAAGPSPYVVEAHYYRALAELRLDDSGAAAADLRAISRDDPVYSRAHTLLDRVMFVEAQRSR